MDDTEQRLRREPPAFQRARVAAVSRLTPRLVRVRLEGLSLAVEEPAASVRVLLPADGALVMPAWNGNEFLLPDGSRPPIRTLTPWPTDGGSLEVDVVLHGTGPLAGWGASAAVGGEVAVSGPGRGYQVDLSAGSYLLAGDETAIPAVRQVVAALPSGMPVDVHIEVGAPEGRLDVPELAGARWHDLPPGARAGDALVEAVLRAELPDDVRVWAAGEAAAVQRIRKHLFDGRGLPRAAAAVRGYWKLGPAL